MNASKKTWIDTDLSFPPKKMTSFSLILATVGRYDELIGLFESINKLDYDFNLIQLIVVDQNREQNLLPLLLKINKKIKVCHIHSEKKGLSFNRNIGILVAKNEVLAFPDDDCEYYPDTLKKIHIFFQKNPHVFLVKGKIYDRKNKRNIFRNWKTTPHAINSRNFYRWTSSITIFMRNIEDIRFDDRLGAGRYFGSNEDTDLIIGILRQGKKIHYDPEIQVFHPQPTKISFDKVFSYGLGFGAVCKKNKMIFLFITILFYHFVKGIFSLVLFKIEDFRYSYIAIFSRVKGFLKFK